MSFEHAFLAGMATLAILQLIALGWMARLSNRMTDFYRRFERLEIHQERSEWGFREELTVNRREIGESLRQNREELNGAIERLSRTLFEQTEQSRRSWEEKLGALQAAHDAHGERLRQLVDEKLNAAQQDARLGRAEQAESLKHFGELLTNQLHHLAQRHGDGMETLRQTVETRLAAIQSDNQQKLEQMRLTVDEKLHNTLEQRLGESFKLVSERLEQVHKGLGEMQTLASGVGDLKKVLTNVKVRGTWGEVQLDQLLEQILSPDQYAKNVVTRPKASERVEFAIKLPGRDGNGSVVWLPIDAKFPLEDYQKLIDAQEAGDMVAMDEAGRALETRIRSEAKGIRDKYLEPPHTTDFGLLFLPIEGLYAEVIRRPGLFDYLQREYRVTVTGPATLTAILNSLQMGFRTLAIEKRSSEVWQVLGAVKTEFGKFGEILAKTRKKLDDASKTIGQAEVRTRAIDRKLKAVESLPPEQVGTFWEEIPEAEFLPAPDLES
ncbi:MAG TPA: DNA recombination protein RmuC [Methylococcus sp.]|nr:DNA recombination protein RmuC [Methylococcus sp.]